MIERGLRWLSRGASLIGMLGMLAMLLHVTVDVIGKWLFHAPLPATIELTAHYYMIAVVFFPLAAVELKNNHIAVEIVSQYLGKVTRRVLVGITCLVGVVYFGMITIRTWHDAMDKYEIGEYLYGSYELEIWASRFFVPLGTGLLTALLLWKGIALFRGEDRLLEEGKDEIEVD